jgi:hypothetical protein
LRLFDQADLRSGSDTPPIFLGRLFHGVGERTNPLDKGVPEVLRRDSGPGIECSKGSQGRSRKIENRETLGRTREPAILEQFDARLDSPGLNQT